MVNHVRTLLLNRGRDGHAPTFPGEEYLVPNYRRRQLSGAAKRAWNWLFGLTPDRLFLNFRLRQLLTIVHASELVGFVTEADSRITYWPFDDTALAAVFGVTTTIEQGELTAPYVFGSPLCDEGAGICEQAWRVTATTSTELAIQHLVQRNLTAIASLTFSGGLSSPVTLPGAMLTLRFRELVADDAIRVTARGQPQNDLGEVLAGLAAMLGPEDATSLFPGTTTGKTLLMVWTTHPTSMMRYAAIILALALTIEQLPQE